MSCQRKRLGLYGENRAIGFLKKKGYKLLQRNYKTPLGEIDIVAEKEGVIVFVEVKSLSSSLFGPPYMKVTKEKRDKIAKTALLYLINHGLLEREARIDVLSISFDKGQGKIFELIENAFEAERWY